MCAVAVGQARIDAILIIGIRRMTEMEKKSGNFNLFNRGEGRNALLDVFNAHGVKIRKFCRRASVEWPNDLKLSDDPCVAQPVRKQRM